VIPHLLALALTLAPTAPPLQAGGDKFSGQWKVQNDIQGNVSEMNCTFTVKGQDLTGGCGNETTKADIAGTIDGANVAWVYRGTYEGNPITVRYTGTLGETGEIRGSVSVDEFSVSGDFKATTVKN
jgi:hypothetical protein